MGRPLTAPEFVAALAAKGIPARRRGNIWLAPCPAHKDDTPSLGIAEGKKGVVVRCHAECDQTAVLQAFKRLGISLFTTSDEPAKPAKKKPKRPPSLILPAAPDHLPLPYDENGSWILPHYLHGNPVRWWPYYRPDGRIAGYACRFNLKDGTKEVLPLAPARPAGTNRIVWEWTGMAGPRPLYNLPKLIANPQALVIVGEGEKTADAIELLFPNCLATTSPGGGKAPGFTDWTPLSGRHVLIWPDFDHPGMSYAARVAYCTHQVGALSVRLIDFPWWGLPQEIEGAWRLVARNAPVPDGHDADDAIKEGWTPELARTLLPEHARLITVMSV